MRLRVLALVVGALGLSACGRGSIDLNVPKVPRTTSTTATSAPPDYSGVALAGVQGTTTVPPPDTTPGRAVLTGVVSGPGGPVGGATVRVDRLVGDQEQTTQVAANADGTWRVANLLGGRYRVRAWRAPDLFQNGASVFFIGASDRRSVPLNLTAVSGTVVRAALAPSPPLVDELANLVVTIATRAVDGEGIVRASPVAGATVTLYATGSVSVRTPNPAVSDGAGRASWQLVCRAEGDLGLSVGIATATGSEIQNVSTPACAPRPPPTTEAPRSTTTPGG